MEMRSTDTLDGAGGGGGAGSADGTNGASGAAGGGDAGGGGGETNGGGDPSSSDRGLILERDDPNSATLSYKVTFTSTDQQDNLTIKGADIVRAFVEVYGTLPQGATLTIKVGGCTMDVKGSSEYKLSPTARVGIRLHQVGGSDGPSCMFSGNILPNHRLPAPPNITKNQDYHNQLSKNQDVLN